MSQVDNTTGDTTTESAAVTPTSEGEDPTNAAQQPGSAPAGEGGTGSDGDPEGPGGVDGADVIIGEIPDIHDLSVMRWTARCSDPSHDLLGHYDSREQATQAKDEHLASMHTGRPNGV